MKIIAVTQARSGSTRLPAKIFREINGKSLLRIHLERIKKAKRVDQIIVATTMVEEDLRVCKVADDLMLTHFRGSENDVLDRFYKAVRDHVPDYVIRVTSDCPLVDPGLIDTLVDLALKNKADYCSNVLKETFPDGQDIEIFTFAALEKAWTNATMKSDREHVTPYIRNNSDLKGGNIFKAINLEAEKNYGGVRMTVDELADYEVISELVTKLGTERTWQEYADYIIGHKGISTRNSHIARNEGYEKSLKENNKNEHPL